jgi:hypothetical protein
VKKLDDFFMNLVRVSDHKLSVNVKGRAAWTADSRAAWTAVSRPW